MYDNSEEILVLDHGTSWSLGLLGSLRFTVNTFLSF